MAAPPSPSLTKVSTPFVPRYDGPCHPVYLPGRAAHHPGVPGLHLLWMLQAPQPSELQGTGPLPPLTAARPGPGGDVHSLSTAPPPFLASAAFSRSYSSTRKVWVVGCNVRPPSPPLPGSLHGPPPQSSVRLLLGARMPAGAIILGVKSLLVWRVLVQEDRFCLPLRVSAVICRQKSQQVTREVTARPTCPHRSR